MSRELDNKEAMIIMDGAGWHKSKDLVIPTNITIKYLPPYSPELNPVERIWLYIKQHTIKNKIYEDISSLEDTVCDFIKNLDAELIRSICNYGH